MTGTGAQMQVGISKSTPDEWVSQVRSSSKTFISVRA